MATAISNPPYNLKWEPTVLANLENRFVYGVPPKSNANYAFVLSALEKMKDAFLSCQEMSWILTQKKKKQLLKDWSKIILLMRQCFFQITCLKQPAYQRVF